jgi:nitrate/nitrite-specific signal transduction histidine kinase
VKRPSLPRSLSIRSRLLLFLALSVVLTALAISIVTSIIGSSDARNRVIGQLKSVATLKEQEISTWTNGLGLNLDIVLSATEIPGDLRVLALPASDDAARREAYAGVEERFSWAAERMGLFEELFFLDTEGVVLVSTDSGHEGQRLGLNDYFVQGLRGTYLQEPSYSLSLGRMTIVASAPVKKDGRTLGVIAGRADLDGLNQIMIERAGLGETGETYLVGSNYRLLTYLRQPGFSIPDTYIRTEGTDAAIGLAQDGSDTYEGYTGTSVIGVYEWIPELNVALVAEQEEAEALGPTRVALAIMGGVAVLAAALAILAGIALTRRIVRPLARLGSTAGRIAAGELDLVADVVQEDEIGTLAQAFNSMTARLRDLVRSLERRTDHLRAINEAGRHISAILELDQLLPYVARSLLSTFDYQSVRILLLTGNLCGSLLTCTEDADCGEPVFVDLNEPVFLTAITVVATTGNQLLLEVGAESGVDGWTKGEATTYSEIAVPIRVKENLVGVLDITARSAHPLDEQDVFAAQTIADQLAIAIENSRLYRHADELAASRERQRLARDLHDAVSQTLFSVSLIAEVLPRIYERNQAEGRQRLEELRTLTRGALAEMRTLLLELRPTALAEAPLPDLLRQLGEAAVGRARIPVEVEVDGGCVALPTDVRIALYYVTQEALNNVAKHSRASRARVELTCGQAGVRLLIEDDGTGFDPAESGAGQLGLGIMRERAESFGGTLDVRSAPGLGTKVLVTWSPTATPR